jgi:putative nucleotidyltransferase with HDIG domain
VLEFFHRATYEMTEEKLNLVHSFVNRVNLAVQRFRLVEDLQMAHLNIEVAYFDTLKGWVKALDLRDEETEHHAVRVTAMTQRLAVKMGVFGEDLIQIGRGALLHDIGKMAIPDSVLNKPGPLTKEERTFMQKHPEFAYGFLKDIDYLRPALEIPYCHHEKWDG